MTNKVLIKQGTYAKQPIVDQVFEMVRPISHGKNGAFVTVDGSELTGQPGRNIRVLVDSEADVEYHGTTEASQETKPAETPEEAKERIRRRFEILDQMSNAVADGIVRGLIVSGPPGVGKSFGIEKILDMYRSQGRLQQQPNKDYEFIKGGVTAIGLYKALWDNSQRGNVLVFDDCDSVLWDEQCLNLLKAVLDSGKKRKVHWRSESHALNKEDIPKEFDFEGCVIFITNLNFETVRSKKIAPHLEAIMSRCHYIDLAMESISDRLLRIEQIVGDGMLNEYNFGEQGDAEVVEFVKENAVQLREVSLRMVLKIADLKAMSKETWKELASTTCMKRAG